MQSALASGLLIDLILGLVVLEALALAAWRQMSGRGLQTWDLIGNLAAGACLLLALRAALTGQGWTWIAFWLAASLPAHLFDLRRRLRAPTGEEKYSIGTRAWTGSKPEKDYDPV